MNGEPTPMSNPSTPEVTRALKPCPDNAEMRAGQWLAYGNAAQERGDVALAERHYARAQRHLDNANKLRGWA